MCLSAAPQSENVYSDCGSSSAPGGSAQGPSSRLPAGVSEVNSLLSVVVNDETREIKVKSRVLFQEDKVSCKPLVRGDSRGE